MPPKKIKLLTSIKLLIIAGILLFSTTANASPMKLNVHEDFFGYTDIEISFNDDTPLYVDAGEFQVWYTEGNTSGFFPAFCVDLSTAVHYGENNIDGILSPEAYTAKNSYDYDQNGLYVEWLVDYAFSSGIRIAGSDTAGAGLQLAIWEVLYDFDDQSTLDDYNLNSKSGIFTYNENSTTSNTDGWYQKYINSFLTEFDNGFSYTSSGKYKVMQLTTEEENGGNTQDLITVVPEPATMLLFGIGLLGIGALGRKRQI